MAGKPRELEMPDETQPTSIPPPVDGGTGITESLGQKVDDFMGDRRARKEAAKLLEALFLGQGQPDPDPEPSEPPAPVPDGTGTSTRGGRTGETKGRAH